MYIIIWIYFIRLVLDGEIRVRIITEIVTVVTDDFDWVSFPIYLSE